MNPGRISAIIGGHETTIYFEDFDELVVFANTPKRNKQGRVAIHVEMMDKRSVWSKIGGFVVNLSWTAKGRMTYYGDNEGE